MALYKEIGRQLMRAPQAAAISPLLTLLFNSVGRKGRWRDRRRGWGSVEQKTHGRGGPKVVSNSCAGL